MRYIVEISFDGSAYHGWQVQPNANSVQGHIEETLAIFLQEKVSIMGCGRTDTGVHSKQFFFHFETEKDVFNLCFRMNQMLSPHVAFTAYWTCPDDFHVRFDARTRRYVYKIHRQKDPFLNGRSYLYKQELNIDLMNQACTWLLSQDEFGAFCKANSDNKTNICKLSECVWIEKADQLIFSIKADRFLRNMVRAIVGTTLEVGLGRNTLEEFKAIVNSNNRSAAGVSVPAHGLYLEKVDYDQTSWKLIG